MPFLRKCFVCWFVFSSYNILAYETCTLSKKIESQIKSYSSVVKKIIETATEGDFRGKTYHDLANFVDKFGSRFTGTENLENAIDYMIDKSKKYGFDNVHGETVDVPKWKRGTEYATMILPRREKLDILGLGYSVPTPSEGITAEVLVVKTFDELEKKSHLIKGKIVVFNAIYSDYVSTKEYRKKGAVAAAKYGAVAALIRSVTPFSLGNPHTGMQDYLDDVKKIPAAAITVENAHMLQRLQDRGHKIKIFLKMKSKSYSRVKSRNVVFEMKGRLYPEKIVVVSGHIDSWDVGDGVVDNGGGVFVTWEALALLKYLGLRPRRTIRGILWTAEEQHMLGAKAYKERHGEKDFVFMMESDAGTFTPKGLRYTASRLGGCILKNIMELFEDIDATEAIASSSTFLRGGADISLWTKKKIPGATLYTENDKYFWYHHSKADSMKVYHFKDLDKDTALWAAVAYIIADLKTEFPKNS